MNFILYAIKLHKNTANVITTSRTIPRKIIKNSGGKSQQRLNKSGSQLVAEKLRHQHRRFNIISSFLFTIIFQCFGECVTHFQYCTFCSKKWHVKFKPATAKMATAAESALY